MTELSPDFRRAWSVVEEHSKSEDPVPLQRNILQEDVLVSNTILHYSRRIRVGDLPEGPNWRWNQTRKRHVFAHNEDGSISAIKLTTRRKPCQSERPPSGKMWIFTITNGARPISEAKTVMWVERAPNAFLLPTGPTSDDLHLDDFIFLANDMDPTVAYELWPQLRSHLHETSYFSASR